MEINEQKFTRAELENKLDFMYEAYMENLRYLHKLGRCTFMPSLEKAEEETKEKVEAIRLAIQHLYPKKIEYEYSIGWAHVRRKQ